jgi:hypothetical protein
MYVSDKLLNYSAINEMPIAKITTDTRNKIVIDFKYEAN